MIICALQGGLGNQMFQYATLIGIAREDESVLLDLHLLYDRTEASVIFTPRRYALSIFSRINPKRASSLVHRIFNRNEFMWRAVRRLAIRSIRYIENYDNKFCPELLSRNYSVYLNGYFQSEKYFREKRERLVHDFTFPELDEENKRIAEAIAAHPNSVSVHIRRGDYLKPEVLEYHGVVPLEYYTQAIRQIEEKVSNPYFYIFSEDVAWCQQNLGFLNGRMTLVGNINAKDGWKDMCLMTHCRHHIVANSSFSWWGAWLAQQDGLNFAPAAWFNRHSTRYRIEFNIEDIVPDWWTVIDVPNR